MNAALSEQNGQSLWVAGCCQVTMTYELQLTEEGFNGTPIQTEGGYIKPSMTGSKTVTELLKPIPHNSKHVPCLLCQKQLLLVICWIVACIEKRIITTTHAIKIAL